MGKTKSKAAAKTKTSPSGAGVKFTEKYGCSLASTYEIDPDKLVIPPPGHFLHDPDGNTTFDEERVKEIDAVGQCVRTITAWSDPDTGSLYVIAGRGNTLDVREVNRRRLADSPPRDPIKIGFLRFRGTEEQAADFVAMENFRRKRPSLVHIAHEIVRYKHLGRGWVRIAALLGLDGENEKALKVRIPIAYCAPEVVEAIETKKIAIGKAKKFGGSAWDGNSALGKSEQVALLHEMLKARADKVGSSGAETTEKRPPAVPRAVRERVAEALVNGRAKALGGVQGPKYDEQTVARLASCLIRRLDGEETALDAYASFKAIVDEAIAASRAKPDAKTAAA